MISVIIPTHNRLEILKKTLIAFKNQTINKNYFEIVIVDDGSTDETVKYMKKNIHNYPYQIKIFSQENKGPSSARNLGILNSKGEIVVIINDDTIPAVNFLKIHEQFHKQHPKINHAVLGKVTWHDELKITPFMEWLENGGPYFSYYGIKKNIAGWQRFWTCNISLKKEFLLKNGLFDESFPTAAWEDIELGYRLHKVNLKLFYEPKALGYHHHETSIVSIKNKMINNGRNLLNLYKKIPYKYLPPLAKHQNMAIFIDTIVFTKPVEWLLEKIARFFEDKIKTPFIFDLILLHYRILGIKKFKKFDSVMKNYQNLLSQEINEWKIIESQTSRQGIPWWSDLRQANISKNNLGWHDDYLKEEIVRGEEKKTIISLAKKNKGKVLDLGCGSGWLSLELARNGLNVVGIDISPDRIAIAKEYLKNNPFKKNFGSIKYQVVDINLINFKPNSFDTIVSWDSIHHLPDFEKNILKINNILKPGGKIIIYDHIGNKFLKIFSLLSKKIFKKNEGKIIAYEDLLGDEVIKIIKKYYDIKFFKSGICFPTSIALYLFFRYDFLLPCLPVLIKLDRIICKTKAMKGEYFLLEAKKKL